MSYDWIENVSLMIIFPIDHSRSSYNYKIYLKQHERNDHFYSGLSEKFLFEKLPRLNLSIEDFHKSWIGIIESDFLPKHIRNVKFKNVPMIKNGISFRSGLDHLNGSYHQDTILALRICALRCLFQEIGVLLLEKQQDYLPDLSRWMEKVRTNPASFLELFQTYSSLKLNFDRLYEWRNWLTPTTVGHSPRFDTMFYLIILNATEGIHKMFSSNGYWTTLDSITSVMPPNDFYELMCLSRFHQIDHLKWYLREEYPKIPLERWLPSVQLYQDGSISLLPGDQLYPERVALIVEKPPRMNANQTLETNKEKSQLKSLNRIEHRGFECRIIVSGEVTKQNYHFPVGKNNQIGPIRSKL